MNRNRRQTKKTFILVLLSLLFLFFAASCRTIQVKENTDKQDISQNPVAPKAEEITPERIIITPEVISVKQVTSAPMTIKQVSKSAIASMKAAPAKVVDISNKIAASVKAETKNAFENWPVFIYVFIGVIIVYIIFDNIDFKSRKKRRKKGRNTTKIT